MDFPGADVIADRLAAMNPLAQIDEKSDIPPQVQMELAQAKKAVQDMQNQMAAMQLAMKQRADIEGVKQQAETQRESDAHSTAKAHNTETMAEVKVNDQNTDQSPAKTRPKSRLWFSCCCITWTPAV